MSGETTAASRACSVKTGPAARALEKACWVVGLLLLALYCSARTYGELERREAVSAFADLSTGADTLVTRDSVVRSLPENRTPDQTQWSASRIRAFAASPRAPAESASLPAALLRISRVGLKVPVYADMTERNLNRGAGLIAKTAALDSDGNIAIAAHRDGYFRALESVAVGDVVELETLAQRRPYRVTELAIVWPTDIWPLHETGGPAVTLVTCYPFYFVGNAPQRFIVRAVAIE